MEFSHTALVCFGLRPEFLPGWVREVPEPLKVSLHCYPMTMMPGNERHDVEIGGNIILPPCVQQHMIRLLRNNECPHHFQLKNKVSTDRDTHCGVLEYSAGFRRYYIPNSMMRNLALQPGDLVQVESTPLPNARFSKFEPQSADFLDITNPKAILKNALRNISCLTEGEIIPAIYNGKVYELRVLETRPSPDVSILEGNMEVVFAPPVGYVDPERK